MTPLAQYLVRAHLNGDFAAPVDGPFRDAAAALAGSAAQCFEVSEVWEMADALMRHRSYKHLEDPNLFLPAPVTWIEWTRTSDEERRLAVLVAEMAPKTWKIQVFADKANGNIATGTAITWIIEGNNVFFPIEHPNDLTPASQDFYIETTRMVSAYLCVINTPLVVRQEKHEPRAELRRKLLRAGVIDGKTRFQPWVTIKLDVQTPSEIEGGGSRMTGTKAFHFCRAHLRLRLGKVEWVRSHWRGDANKGVVNHDYRVRA